MESPADTGHAQTGTDAGSLHKPSSIHSHDVLLSDSGKLAPRFGRRISQTCGGNDERGLF
jgi:hypothetical protein